MLGVGAVGVGVAGPDDADGVVPADEATLAWPRRVQAATTVAVPSPAASASASRRAIRLMA